MSLSRSLSGFFPALFIALLFLTGCGFTPVYATGSSTQPATATSLGAIEVGLIADHEGQHLRNALLDRLGSSSTSTGQRYFLRIHALKIEDIGFGLRKDASYTRGDITISAKMDLIDTQGNTVALTRSLSARGGYNRMDNLYGAEVSKENTIERLLNEMADQATTELALHFNRQKGG